jgi:glycerol-3-phosphate dehydrogenase (NAD(P)+)
MGSLASDSPVAIIGDGAMGTVCAIMLAENGVGVRLWSAFPQAAAKMDRRRESAFLPGCPLDDAIEVTGDDARALDGVRLAISAVPTQYMRPVWRRLVAHAPAGLAVCSVAKGIENGTLLRPTQILRDVLADAGPIAALSGPSIAPELAAHLPATVTVASADSWLAETVQQLINRPYFRVYTNADLVGVELAGATKNVVAIAAGIIDGMELGTNAKAALVTRGLTEITRLGVALGARAETFAGLAGVGDLMTTCISPVGRNRSFGERVGRGATVADALAATDSVVEGVTTTSSVVALSEREGVEMPITRAVHDVLFSGVAPRTAIADLMARPLKSEV